MLFNSIQFLIFFPIVLLIYFILPNRIRYIWLLLVSYYFYMSWNPKYVLLILFSTVVTYISGLLIETIKGKKWDYARKKRYKNIVVACGLILNLGVLFYYKYINFAVSILGDLLSVFNVQMKVPDFDIVLPVGISFYTFQALGYIMDVYRDDIYAEKNFFRYALFVSFFPQLVAGPIERSKNLLKQLAEPRKFNFENARDGFLLMLWGYFLKVVLADRIAIFVDTVYTNYINFAGWYLILATMLFAIQIYCDFSGYSMLAMGAAEILGIHLIENFQTPYFSTSVAEFWRNWHISLTSWFKDYLYIPLGGGRKGRGRKYLNKMIVFLVSGLWHGAHFSYVIWGGLNGLYQIAGEITLPIRDKMVAILQLRRDSFAHKLLQGAVTFLAVDFTWVFFRAESVGDAFEIINSMFTVKNPWVLLDGSLYVIMDSKNFWLMLICILVLLFADICKYKKIIIRKLIAEQDYWFRWITIAFAICVILTFGIWGPGYSESNFIYFQF